MNPVFYIFIHCQIYSTKSIYIYIYTVIYIYLTDIYLCIYISQTVHYAHELPWRHWRIGNNRESISSVYIYAYISGAQLGAEGEASPAFFFKSKKMCPDFRKKGPNCVHPYAKFTIQHVVLRTSKIKNFKIFPCGAI